MSNLAQKLRDLAGAGPHPLRDAHLESALLHAYRAGELVTHDEARALVAAALQRAALKIVSLPGGTVMHSPPQLLTEAHDQILSLIDTDHAAALEAVKAQARNDGIEWAADHVEGYASPELSMMAEAIRAGKVQP